MGTLLIRRTSAWRNGCVRCVIAAIRSVSVSVCDRRRYIRIVQRRWKSVRTWPEEGGNWDNSTPSTRRNSKRKQIKEVQVNQSIDRGDLAIDHSQQKKTQKEENFASQRDRAIKSRRKILKQKKNKKLRKQLPQSVKKTQKSLIFFLYFDLDLDSDWQLRKVAVIFQHSHPPPSSTIFFAVPRVSDGVRGVCAWCVCAIIKFDNCAKNVWDQNSQRASQPASQKPNKSKSK